MVVDPLLFGIETAAVDVENSGDLVVKVFELPVTDREVVVGFGVKLEVETNASATVVV